MSGKPTLVFVPGAWHSSACYGKVVSTLQQCGYRCEAIELATVDPVKPVADDADTDAAVILNATEKVLGAGNDVVLVLHSYAGIPGMCAAYSLRDRQSPGVKGIAMIASFLSPPKTSMVALLAKHSISTGFHKFDSTGTLIEVGRRPESLFYNDLPLLEAAEWAARLKPQSWASNVKPPSADGVGWHHIPTHYLVCESDQAVSPSLQRKMVDDSNATLAAMGSELRIHVERAPSGHCPFLSMPPETAQYIRRAAGEIV